LLLFLLTAILFALHIRNVFIRSGELIFWVCILLFFAIIIYQIFYTNTSSKIIILEIFLLYIFLHLIYQMGYIGLRGSDAYFDYRFLTTILSENRFKLGSGPHSVGGWPMLHIFSAEIVFFTGIDPLPLAKFLPTFLASLMLYPLYLLASRIYNDGRFSLFTCLVFGTIPQFMRFDGLFVREVFALLMTIYFVYILHRFRESNDYRYTLMLSIVLPVIVLAHHFTSVMLAILIVIYILIALISSYWHKDSDRNVSRSPLFLLIPAIFILIVLGYIVSQPLTLSSINTIISNIFAHTDAPTLSEKLKLGTPIVTIRGKILYYGFYFFNFLFAGILLVKILFHKYKKKIEELSFSVFFFFYGVYGFLSLYVIRLLTPERLQTMAWMLGIIPLGAMFFFFRKDWHKKLFVIVLVLFMCYNIYNIEPPYRSREFQRIDNIAGYKEYIIAYTIQFPDNFTLPDSHEKYYGYVGAVAAIYHVQGITQRTQGRSWAEVKNLPESDSILILKEKSIPDLETVKKKVPKTYEHYLEILNYKNDINVNKICDIGDPYVLKGGGSN